MKSLEYLLAQVEGVSFNGKPNCIELLDNCLQDVLFHLETMGHRASGELIELRGCSWVLHERYHMDTEEQLKWTFHHTKFKIMRSCQSLLNSKRLVKRAELQV